VEVRQYQIQLLLLVEAVRVPQEVMLRVHYPVLVALATSFRYREQTLIMLQVAQVVEAMHPYYPCL
jgi:hypothetical protein